MIFIAYILVLHNCPYATCNHNLIYNLYIQTLINDTMHNTVTAPFLEATLSCHKVE